MAHGSARNADSAEPVLALARELRRRGFAEVRTAFWKEEPFLHQVLPTLGSPRVAVLPVFLAEGYFGRTVVPREMGLRYGAQSRGGRRVSLLRPLGTAPELDEIVLEHARKSLPDPAVAGQAVLVVLGHGTPRDPRSGATVYEVCRRLASRGTFGRVAPAFIDQDPRVEDVVADAPEGRVVLVPFLVSTGWHGGVTVPRELGLSDGPGKGEREGASLVYAEPVGLHPRIADVVTALIRETAAEEGGGEGRPPAAGPESELARAAELLEERLSGGAVTLLEVTIRARGKPGGGHYELRHRADPEADSADLTTLDGLEALERTARRGPDGGHRPLRSRADLTRGWRLEVWGAEMLAEALVTLYGAALVHWYRGEQGTARATSFREAVARQTGMYATLARADPATVEAAIRRCCRGLPCLRERRWRARSDPADHPPPERSRAETGMGADVRLSVPCTEPCPVLLSAVLEESTDESPAESAAASTKGTKGVDSTPPVD